MEATATNLTNLLHLVNKLSGFSGKIHPVGADKTLPDYGKHVVVIHTKQSISDSELREMAKYGNLVQAGDFVHMDGLNQYEYGYKFLVDSDPQFKAVLPRDIFKADRDEKPLQDIRKTAGQQELLRDEIFEELFRPRRKDPGGQETAITLRDARDFLLSLQDEDLDRPFIIGGEQFMGHVFKVERIHTDAVCPDEYLEPYNPEIDTPDDILYPAGTIVFAYN